ncbi:hypothetical protein Pmani_027779 [Petrolisthes manimaculis]|uniref:G-protein coupled receptors family 1 profile domain-containing protein n=1 Tax=Petrolisthes manimaculis TaxID=1843537 RepID=A0AAE1P1E1_9EUCA|nr:hypothetical protein Pmani_027779 [Petrolisthes manimaculis]
MDNMTDQARDVVGLDIASTTTLLNPEESINATYKNVTDNYLYHGTPAVVTMSILIVISMILALGGNIMVIITIARHRGMRTRTNLLLANLAVADILVAVLDMPFALITIIKGKWIFSQNFCYFNGFTVGLGLMLSVQTLMWISIHKFISITRPFSRTVTPGKIVLMMLAAWGWTILFNLTPTPVLAPLNLQLTNTVYKKGASQCGPPVPTNSRQLIHSALNTIFNLVIPFIVMIYCYYRIFKEVRTHLNRMKDFADTSRWNTINQQRRITETLCIVLLIFFLFWMPYIIYSLTLVAKKSINPVLNPISYMFGYMNSACNPIIYALRSPTFRRGFKEIICRGDQGPGEVDIFSNGELDFLANLNLHTQGDERFPMFGRMSTRSVCIVASR